MPPWNVCDLSDWSAAGVTKVVPKIKAVNSGHSRCCLYITNQQDAFFFSSQLSGVNSNETEMPKYLEEYLSYFPVQTLLIKV